MAEHLPVEQVVAGSNPVSHPGVVASSLRLLTAKKCGWCLIGGRRM